MLSNVANAFIVTTDLFVENPAKNADAAMQITLTIIKGMGFSP
jgi:hypothetical protein